MVEIVLKDVVKTYPRFSLGPINLTIQANEFFGIFGPPSSGKTSLLKLILGLVRADSGQVLIDGKDMSGVEVDQRNLAMVFQNLALFPHMTGEQIITFPLTERHIAPDEVRRKLKTVSEVLHVTHILHKQPGQMSGGERQRIALGRAFVREPGAFLLDEPIAALDARLREEMRVELKRLQRENAHTFIYVSHDEEEVLSVSDTMAIVLDGKIAQIGRPDDIYDHPNSVAVATLVGSPPMNIIDGAIGGDGNRFSATPLGLRISVGELADHAKGLGKLGIRPEDLRPVAESGEHTIDGEVVAVEPLGGFTIVDIHAGDGMLKMRLPGQARFAERELVHLGLDVSRTHLFDAAGNSIPRRELTGSTVPFGRTMLGRLL